MYITKIKYPEPGTMYVIQALLYPLLKSEQERNLCLHKTVSIRKLRHLEEVAANEENSFVLQGVRCSENSKEIMLNNKGITDADLF
jgi:tryptophanase